MATVLLWYMGLEKNQLPLNPHRKNIYFRLQYYHDKIHGTLINQSHWTITEKNIFFFCLQYYCGAQDLEYF